MDVCSRHGPFDVVIDDGGHTGGLIWASLRAIFPGRRCMRSTGSVYVIEDACTMASKEFVQHPLDIAGIAAQAWWSMHHHWLTAPELKPVLVSEANQALWFENDAKRAPRHPIFEDRVTEVHAYDGILFIGRGHPKPETRIIRGTSRIPY